MYYAKSIDEELAHPPADWLVLTRDYATQSGDTAALEPDNANGWYDADKQELHLVVPTQSPQEVAEGAATMLAKSRIGLKRLFLHPCFTVGYGSKDHAPCRITASSPRSTATAGRCGSPTIDSSSSRPA